MKHVHPSLSARKSIESSFHQCGGPMRQFKNGKGLKKLF